MERDPITNEPLPPDAIQRVLYLAQQVHVYRIPPPSSPRYLTAALWTQNAQDHIFTARVRLVETAIPNSSNASGESVSATILLEDAKSGELFAAAPYTHQSAVEQATDSSRFFSVRVVGQGGMKATLGIGFEQRPEAFDFGVALQDVRRVLDMASAGSQPQQLKSKKEDKDSTEAKRDLSLKEGEMITIKIGGRGRRSAGGDTASSFNSQNPFAIAPPPNSGGAGGGATPFLPPPASASTQEGRVTKKQTAEELGFDDGEFGEFQ